MLSKYNKQEVIMSDNQCISKMLEALGYKLLAEHAKHQANHEILKGYAYIIEQKAKKTNDISILGELFHRGYLL